MISRTASAVTALTLGCVLWLGTPGAPLAQTTESGPLPKVYGPPGLPDTTAPTPPPAPAAAQSAAEPQPGNGASCTAYLGEAGDARTMICALDRPQPLGGVCHCAFPPVPPPGILPSPPAAGHVTR